MNKVILTGYLGREPDLKHTSSDMAVCKFCIAVTSGWGDKKKTNWLNCVCFGKQGEALDKFMVKGSPITIEGHIQTGSYEKDDGTKVYTTDIIVDNWEFAMRDKGQGEREIEKQEPTETGVKILDKMAEFSNDQDESEDLLPF